MPTSHRGPAALNSAAVLLPSPYSCPTMEDESENPYLWQYDEEDFDLFMPVAIDLQCDSVSQGHGYTGPWHPSFHVVDRIYYYISKVEELPTARHNRLAAPHSQYS